MKRLLILLLLLFLFGCHPSTSFNPNITQVIDEIEVHSSYDPLDFIRDVSSNKDYHITVIEDKIDNTKIGNYNVTYEISNKNDETVELSYLITVVDKTAPTIQVITDITTTVNQSFVISDFVKAIDNYDLDITDKLKISGEYDISKAGEYHVQLSVSDSSNNTSTKTTTIYVINEEVPEQSNSLLGVYMVDYTDEDEVNPTLVLSENDTFVLTVNYCAGMRTFNGSYTVQGNTITLQSNTFTFDDDDPSSSSIMLVINDDGSLSYVNDYPACSPLRNDVFIKK